MLTRREIYNLAEDIFKMHFGIGDKMLIDMSIGDLPDSTDAFSLIRQNLNGFGYESTSLTNMNKKEYACEKNCDLLWKGLSL